ncbi:hypothetical protein [Palleronia caenipelagi]|uniref:Uncharacterized protein n=1 Tax=Palleronia caenipelagi TaxID=2489174 RepID=A0A547PY14_9RHOB|nr:hypothetical protein [Palleronia caenipelagi]TRD19047.1 hypothetical protein FEV53_11185 [Palleronia caenipelagi]
MTRSITAALLALMIAAPAVATPAAEVVPAGTPVPPNARVVTTNEASPGDWRWLWVVAAVAAFFVVAED